MESSLVSVVIPTYNRAKLLFECLESILNQTYKKLEILIIDDGSTDDTKNVVNGFKDERIRYFNFGHIGNIASLRNIGIEKSNGEYIAFCDDDDKWLTEKLNVDLKFINGYDIVCSNAFVINSKGLKLRKYFDQLESDMIFTLKDMMYENKVITSTVLLKKLILPSLNPFDIKITKNSAEDFELWLNLSELHQIYFISTPLVFYRMHDNLTYKDDNYPILIKNSVRIISKYRNCRDKEIRKFCRRGMFRFNTFLFFFYYNKRKIFHTFLQILNIIKLFILYPDVLKFYLSKKSGTIFNM